MAAGFGPARLARYCCHQENPLQRSKTASPGARTSSRPLRVQRVLLIVPRFVRLRLLCSTRGDYLARLAAYSMRYTFGAIQIFSHVKLFSTHTKETIPSTADTTVSQNLIQNRGSSS